MLVVKRVKYVLKTLDDYGVYFWIIDFLQGRTQDVVLDYSYWYSMARHSQLADTPTRGLPTRGLDISRTGQLAD